MNSKSRFAEPEEMRRLILVAKKKLFSILATKCKCCTTLNEYHSSIERMARDMEAAGPCRYCSSPEDYEASIRGIADELAPLGFRIRDRDDGTWVTAGGVIALSAHGASVALLIWLLAAQRRLEAEGAE